MNKFSKFSYLHYCHVATIRRHTAFVSDATTSDISLSCLISSVLHMFVKTSSMFKKMYLCIFFFYLFHVAPVPPFMSPSSLLCSHCCCFLLYFEVAHLVFPVSLLTSGLFPNYLSVHWKPCFFLLFVIPACWPSLVPSQHFLSLCF